LSVLVLTEAKSNKYSLTHPVSSDEKNSLCWDFLNLLGPRQQ